MPAPLRFAVIGHPIGHSRSPEIHAAFAAQCGLMLQYHRIDATPAQLSAAVLGFFEAGGSGLNVTVPHKAAALAMCCALSERARLAGVVNTLAPAADGIAGDNTDGIGILRDLQRVAAQRGFDLAGQRLLVLGAGGAARGVLAGLYHVDLASITLHARSPEAARQLATQFEHHGRIAVIAGGQAQSAPFDIVINATAAGINAAVPEFDRRWLECAWLAYDLSYGASVGADTPFLNHARLLGVDLLCDGLGMLVEQAAESFFVWHRLRPEVAPVLERLRRVA